MSTTLTIRNLDSEVKRKLRLRAAAHQTSMEAEARAILSRGVDGEETAPPQTIDEMKKRLLELAGSWTNRSAGETTDEIMREIRGDE